MKRILLPQSLVQSLLSGAIQVSVPVKPQPVCNKFGTWTWRPDTAWRRRHPQFFPSGSSAEELARCMLLHKPAIVPFGDIGTVVLVPETWQIVHSWVDATTHWVTVMYPADRTVLSMKVTNEQWERAHAWQAMEQPMPKRSPATMPEWAARLRYIVEGVKVGRLWDATEADAVAEGFKERRNEQGDLVFTALDYLVTAWDDTYAKRGYPSDTNPWRYSYGLSRL